MLDLHLKLDPLSLALPMLLQVLKMARMLTRTLLGTLDMKLAMGGIPAFALELELGLDLLELYLELVMQILFQ